MKKRIVSIIIIIVMLLTAVHPFTITAVAIDSNGVKTKLDSFIQAHPHESRWTDSFDDGKQCYGFGKLVVYNLFGAYSSSRKRSWTYEGVSTSGMNAIGSITSYSASNVQSLLKQAAIGDVLQFAETYPGSKKGMHTMIIYSVESDGVNIYHCNWDNKCGVRLEKFSFGAWAGRSSAKLTLLRSDNYTPTQIVPETVIAKYRVTADSGLNVRSAPNTSASVVRGLTKGTEVDAYEISGNWARITGGWICTDYCEKIWPAESSAVVSYRIHVDDTSVYDSEGFTVTVTPLINGNDASSSEIKSITLFLQHPDGSLSSSSNTSGEWKYKIPKSFPDGDYKFYAKVETTYGDSEGSVTNGCITVTRKSISGLTGQSWSDATVYRKIVFPDYSKYLTADSDNNVTARSANGTLSQVWKCVKSSDGYYTFYNMSNGLVLDVSKGQYLENQNVLTYTPQDSENQKFQIVKNSDGKYFIRPKESNAAVLRMYNGENNEGQNIVLYTYYDYSSERLNFESPNFTIKFDANGGTATTTSQTVRYDGANWTLSSSKPTRSGYIFTGWSKTSNGPVVYNSGQSIAASQLCDMTLYAVWKTCSHNLTSKILKNATCGSVGLRRYTCDICGYSKSELIPSTGNHSWDSGKVTTASTCKTTGVKTFTCTVCGETKTETIAKNASNHTGGTEIKNEKTATCGVDGYSGDTYCKGCGAKLTSGTMIAKTGNHTWNAGAVTTAATCKSTGVKTYTCTVCKTTKTETIAKNASNHTGGTEIRNAKAATCGEDGYSGDTYCKGCSTKLASGTTIAKTGDHTWNEGTVTKAAQVGVEGEKTFTCTVCGATKTESIPALLAPETTLSVTEAPTVNELTSAVPMTTEPTTLAPISVEPTTEVPTTIEPTTSTLVSIEPTTDPTTSTPVFVEQTTSIPTTTELETTAVEAGPSGSKTEYQIGDVNLDRRVDATDARLVLRVAAKLDTFSNIQMTIADIDGNEGVNAIDARIILRIAAKLETVPGYVVTNITQEGNKKEEAIKKAANYADKEDYENAISTIQDVLNDNESDAELNALFEEYSNKYVAVVVTKVDKLAERKDFTEAVSALEAALKVLEGNDVLKKKLKDIKASQPVSLSTLTPINGGWKWNEGTPTDPFGNTYTEVTNYAIIACAHANDYWGKQRGYAEYRLYGKYKTLSLSLVSHKDIGEDGYSQVKVYADEELVYTSENIARKTDKFSQEINIQGADYIKIEYYGDKGSNNGWSDYTTNTLILMDCRLWRDIDKIDEDIKTSADYAAAEDYINAIYTIQSALKGNEDDTELKALLDDYSNKYVSVVIAKVDDLEGKDNYTEAISTLRSALNILEGNDALKAKLEEFEDKQVVDLSSLSPINGGWKWNEGTPTDPFGNSYTDVSNYAIIACAHANDYGGKQRGYAEYRLYGKYKTLSLSLVSHKDIGEDGYSQVKIYADDKLVYTSTNIERKTDKFSIEVNIQGADYIKIEYYGDKGSDNGWSDYTTNTLILMDCRLWTE